eukprot:750093-Amphidinium_carterae.4
MHVRSFLAAQERSAQSLDDALCNLFLTPAEILDAVPDLDSPDAYDLDACLVEGLPCAPLDLDACGCVRLLPTG